MRKVLIPVVVITLAIAAAAIGGQSERAAAATGSCAKANLNLVKDGQLSIGTDNPAFPPWFAGGETKGRPWKINDPAKGKGFDRFRYAPGAFDPSWRNQRDIEVLTFHQWEMSRFRVQSLDPVEPVPLAQLATIKPFDFDINQISYTPDRAKVLGFSASYYNVNQSIVGLKGKPISSVRSVAGLKQYKLGAQLGTTSYQYIVKNIKPGPSVAVYDTNDAAVAALKNGQIDGLVVDLPTAFYVTAVQVPNGKIIGQFAAKGTQEHFGMVFQKGNSLVACVNNGLANMKRTGVLKRIQQIWLAKVTGAPVLR